MNPFLLIAGLLILSAIVFAVVRIRGNKVTFHRIRGALKITNDCDGQVGSIPKEVTVRVELISDRGNSNAKQQKFPLGPDPSGNPIKNGTYGLDVGWDPGIGNPKTWRITVTEDEARTREVCKSISCPSGACKTMPGNPIEVPYSSNSMTYDINLTCVCT